MSLQADRTSFRLGPLGSPPQGLGVFKMGYTFNSPDSHEINRLRGMRILGPTRRTSDFGNPRAKRYGAAPVLPPGRIGGRSATDSITFLGSRASSSTLVLLAFVCTTSPPKAKANRPRVLRLPLAFRMLFGYRATTSIYEHRWRLSTRDSSSVQVCAITSISPQGSHPRPSNGGRRAAAMCQVTVRGTTGPPSRRVSSPDPAARNPTQTR